MISFREDYIISGFSFATDFISVIMFHCLGLTHEMKMGKWWFMSDSNLLCNIFALLTGGNNYSASLLKDVKKLFFLSDANGMLI